jgi:hypothetical protein
VDRLKKVGVPLESFVEDRQFYRGIVSGLNPAFVINREQRNNLIKDDPKSAEVIKPFLRGRNVKRWRVQFAEEYIIFAKRGFPLESYPAIQAHLEGYRKQLSSRATIGAHPWYELQQPQEGIWHHFEHSKIVYPDIAQRAEFALDQGAFLDSTLFMMRSEKKWLLAMLNSKVIEFYFRSISSSVRGNFLRFKSIYVKTIPIAQPSKSQRTELESFVSNLIQAYKSPSLDTKLIANLEHQINEIVYDVYGVNNDHDRAIIENTVGGEVTPEEVELEETAYRMYGFMSEKSKHEFEKAVTGKKSRRRKVADE